MQFPLIFRALPQHESLRTLVLMRLVALAGQLAVVALSQLWLDIHLFLPPVFAAMLFLAVFNAWTWRRMRRPEPSGDIELFMQLLVDVITLSALLYFSGGATNPFVSFYLPALAVAAAILPWQYAAALAVLSVACYSVLSYVYVPLHVMDPDQAVAYHLDGMWANFAVSAILITGFVAHMSRTLRQRDRQLAQAREQHVQNEGILALGTQAASAAHEMGTPLATVAIIAGELQHEARQDAGLAPYRADLATIEAQIALCTTALDRMRMQAEDETPAASLVDWLAVFIEHWRLRHPAARITLALDAGDPRIAHAHALGRILQTLLDNAVRAAGDVDTPIEIALTAGQGTAAIRITDAGPGIRADLLEKLGHEQVQSTSGGQGIGLMLAFATARQIGATIQFASRHPQGTAATLTIPLA